VKKAATKAKDQLYVPGLDMKLQLACKGLQSYLLNGLVKKVSKENAEVIADYIEALKVESNVSDHYRRAVIALLTTLCEFHRNKAFKEINRTDIISFLNSYRKPEGEDPRHKWIGTYNNYVRHLLRFFRWLYTPELPSRQRPKPAAVQNITQLKRKEESTYTPQDIWTEDDDLLFFKYSHDKRINAYHAISRDTSCRPHELLKLKVKDVYWKNDGTSTYAEITVNGKTGSRTIPLIKSVPFLKDWLLVHPLGGNPNAPLFCSMTRNLLAPLGMPGLYNVYKRLRVEYFPALVLRSDVTNEDNDRIQNLLKKPFNPYIRRHTGLTEKAILIHEHALRQHAGWTKDSKMPLKYLHFFGNESSNALLQAYGVKTKEQLADKLRPKLCPNCNEPNKPDAKICVNPKCHMALSIEVDLERKEKIDFLLDLTSDPTKLKKFLEQE
jgi:integrase